MLGAAQQPAEVFFFEQRVWNRGREREAIRRQREKLLRRARAKKEELGNKAETERQRETARNV